MKRAAIAAAGILLVVAVAQWRQQGGDPLALEIRLPAKTVTLGQAFDVELAVDHMAKDGQVAGFEIMLTFDPAVLQVDEVREGDYLAKSGRSALCPSARVDNIAGTVGLDCASTAPRKTQRMSSGVLGVLVFHSIGAGDTTLRFAETSRLLSDFDGEMDFHPGDATLSVSDSGGTEVSE